MTLALFGAVVAALVIHAASSDDEPTATVGATSHYALGLRAYQANLARRSPIELAGRVALALDGLLDAPVVSATPMGRTATGTVMVTER